MIGEKTNCNWAGAVALILLVCMLLAPMWELTAQTPTAGRNGFAGSTTVRVAHGNAASGTVNVLCGAVTCPAGTYLVSFSAEVVHADLIDMTPTLAATFGWTGETGALTAAASAPGGATTVSTATTGGTFSALRMVHTTGPLTISVTPTGTAGGLLFDWEYAAMRLR